MVDKIKGRAVLVTGASTGIGEACVVRLEQEGFTVFAGVRKPADGQALVDRSSGRVIPILLDVTREEQIRQAARDVREKLPEGGLWGLVNNAGIATGGALEFLPVDALREQLEVNVVGQLAVTQAFLPMIRETRGRIVNMGSIAGLLCNPFQAPYSISKFALEAMTDALRLELRPWGIQVAIIEPGNIATPIWKKSLGAFDRMSERLDPKAYEYYGPVVDKMRAYIAAKDPKVKPAEVAEAVYHALTAGRPRTRYLIGKDARRLSWIARLPDRLRDRLIASRLPEYGDDLPAKGRQDS